MRCHVVGQYFRLAGGFTEPQAMLCTPANTPGDPLYAVWAAVAGAPEAAAGTADDAAAADVGVSSGDAAAP